MIVDSKVSANIVYRHQRVSTQAIEDLRRCVSNDALIDRLGRLPLTGSDRELANELASAYRRDFGHLNTLQWCAVKRFNLRYRNAE